jgi:hypothetical protein
MWLARDWLDWDMLIRVQYSYLFVCTKLRLVEDPDIV